MSFFWYIDSLVAVKNFFESSGYVNYWNIDKTQVKQFPYFTNLLLFTSPVTNMFLTTEFFICLFYQVGKGYLLVKLRNYLSLWTRSPFKFFLLS